MRRQTALCVVAALGLISPACDEDDGPNGASLGVNCSATPASGRVPLIVQFSATATGGGGNHAISWSFGDGSASSEANATRTFGLAGTYNATAEVRSGTQRSSCNVTVTAQAPPAPVLPPNTAPTAVFKISPSPATGARPLDVDFNACLSSDPDGDRLVFKFDTGEGSGEQGHCRKSHTYRTAGTFSTKVCVSDDFPGHADICQSYIVTVK